MDNKTQEEVEQIVSEDENVRSRIAGLVERMTHEIADAPGKVVDFSRETMETAVSAVERAAPKDPESTLRQVVDGLGDGLRRSANATKLAVEEAASEGKTYASEDLKKVGENLRTISDLFAETVRDALKVASGKGRESFDNVAQHAERTMESIRPALKDAASTATRDPVKLAGETAETAANLTREAAGSLFNAIGGALKRAGETLSPPDSEEETKA